MGCTDHTQDYAKNTGRVDGGRGRGNNNRKEFDFLWATHISHSVGEGVQSAGLNDAGRMGGME